MRSSPDIGLSNYPIFDENYRDTLNGKIVDRFLNREIGQESVGLFRHAMRRKMNEIMPYYNQLYQSEKLTIDPLNTVSMRTVTDSLGNASTDTVSESTGTNESTSAGSSRVVGSETPQMQLQGSEDYATSAQDSTSTTSANGSASDRGTVGQTSEQSAKNTSETSGWQGSQTLMLLQFRETFLNIDLQILDELESLFMQVWDNGDEFSEGTYGYVYWPGRISW